MTVSSSTYDRWYSFAQIATLAVLLMVQWAVLPVFAHASGATLLACGATAIAVAAMLTVPDFVARQMSGRKADAPPDMTPDL